jgi:acyl-CoA synthetase (AMP-forming)/AMP-acid ligase II
MRADDFPISVVELIQQAAWRFPERTALVLPDERVSYADLFERSDLLRRRLQGLGARPGDHIGILMPGGAAFVESMVAVALVGAVAVPLNARYRLELADVVRRADLAYLLTMDRGRLGGDFVATLARCFPGLSGQPDPTALRLPGAPCLRSVVLVRGERPGPGYLGAQQLAGLESGHGQPAHKPSADEMACILFTSGTTSAPKGCMLTHRALVQRPVARARDRLATSGHDVFWSSGPLYHVAAAQILLGCFGVAGTFVTSSHFDPAEIVGLLRANPPTTAWPWFPAIIESLLEEPSFTDDVFAEARSIGLIGPPELLRRVQRRFPAAELLTSCGMTETGGTYAISGRDDTTEVRATTAGLAEAGVEIEIRAGGGSRLARDGEVGELYVRSPTIMTGYYGTDEGLDGDGWLQTGDLFARAATGHLSFFGRLKDMLKVGGENVAAVEIEALVARHEAVKIVEVVGAPHPRLDEVPVAFVELRSGAAVDPGDLIEFCRGQVAAFKVPHAVYLIGTGEWPMSATKVDKRVLRRWAADPGSPRTSQPAGDGIPAAAR